MAMTSVGFDVFNRLLSCATTDVLCKSAISTKEGFFSDEWDDLRKRVEELEATMKRIKNGVIAPAVSKECPIKLHFRAEDRVLKF